MKDWLQRVHPDADKNSATECRSGDQVRVWYRIRERGRVRTAPFEGIVLRVRGEKSSRTLTVRRVTFGQGVERVFQLGGPSIDRIEVVRRGKVRRSRLYFLRTLVGKARIASKDTGVSVNKPESPKVISAAEPSADVPAVAEEPSGSANAAT